MCGGCARATMNVWGSEDKLQESVLSFNHARPGYHDEAIGTGATSPTLRFALLKKLAKSLGLVLLIRLRAHPTLNRSLGDMWLSLDVRASPKPPGLWMFKVVPHKRIIQSSLRRRRVLDTNHYNTPSEPCPLVLRCHCDSSVLPLFSASTAAVAEYYI